MKYHLVTTGGGVGKTDWEVHRHGCADVIRAKRQRAVNAVNTIEAENPEALIERELKDVLQDMGYDRSDFRVMPCCK